MIDSFGKPGAGVLDGNIKWLGSFDECLNIDPVVYGNPLKKTDPTTPFGTQWCDAKMPFPTDLLPVPISVCKNFNSYTLFIICKY